jgi:hypothetical protein
MMPLLEICGTLLVIMTTLTLAVSLFRLIIFIMLGE